MLFGLFALNTECVRSIIEVVFVLPGGDVGRLCLVGVEEPGLAAVPHRDAAQALVQPAVHHQLLVLAPLPAKQEHHRLQLLLLLLHQGAAEAGGGETDGELQVVFLLWKLQLGL